MEFDYSELRGRIVAMYGNVKTYAKMHHYDQNRIYRIVQGKSDVPTSMIDAMREDLDIPLEEVGKFFLTRKFAKAN